MNIFKHVLYFAIGVLTFLSAVPEIPINVRIVCGAVNAGLVATKALGSNPNKEKKE